MVGVVPHLAPSGAPPLGQNTETNVSLASQLTAPSACTRRRFAVPGSPLSPSRPFHRVSPADLVVPAVPLNLAAPPRPECPELPAVPLVLVGLCHPWDLAPDRMQPARVILRSSGQEEVSCCTSSPRSVLIRLLDIRTTSIRRPRAAGSSARTIGPAAAAS